MYNFNKKEELDMVEEHVTSYIAHSLAPMWYFVIYSMVYSLVMKLHM